MSGRRLLYLTLSLALFSSAGSAQTDLLKSLRGGGDDAFAASSLSDLGPSDDELPDPEIAFTPSLLSPDAATVIARWTIQDCCYLYQKRFKFVSNTPGLTLGEPRFPPGEDYEDEFFGRTQIYRGQVDVAIPVVRDAGAAATQIEIQATYQGCADIGVCYPPQQTLLLTGLATAGAAPGGAASAAPSTLSAVAAAPALTAASAEQPMVSEQDLMASLLSEQRFLALPAFFLAGLLLAFTPCVFPMIPILSGIITGQGENLSQRRAFLLSLVYVLAMALTYTVVGVSAALLGQNVQIWFQNPWVLVAFSGLFVLLALSMFGFYELQMPSALQSRLSAVSNRQGSGYGGVAAMGLLSALIVGPCVAPPLIGALTVIGSSGDALLGGSALFAMSLGMGAPLLLIGTSAGKLLPQAGVWMDAIKTVFGVLLLAVAIYLLERILPAVVSMLLWATLLIVSAVYMGALGGGAAAAGGGWRTLNRGLGTVLLVYGILLLVGVAAGGRDTLQPLRGVTLTQGGAAQTALQFTYIKTVDDLDRHIAAAGARPVMLDFYADWCVSCKEMERYTFSDPQVRAALGDALLLKADVTANDAADRTLLQRFGLIGPPATLFFNADGSERPNYRVVGFMPAAGFASHVDRALRPSV